MRKQAVGLLPSKTTEGSLGWSQQVRVRPLKKAGVKGLALRCTSRAGPAAADAGGARFRLRVAPAEAPDGRPTGQPGGARVGPVEDAPGPGDARTSSAVDYAAGARAGGGRCRGAGVCGGARTAAALSSLRRWSPDVTKACPLRARGRDASPRDKAKAGARAALAAPASRTGSRSRGRAGILSRRCGPCRRSLRSTSGVLPLGAVQAGAAAGGGAP